jgi:hypothetical protein
MGLSGGGTQARDFRGLGHDGGDYSSATDAATGNEFDFGTASWSVGFWYKSTGGVIGVTNKRAAGVGWQLLLRDDSADGFLLRQNDGGNVDITPDGDQTATMFDGAWHHLLISVDRTGNVGNAWLDGSIITTNTDISGLTGSTDNTEPVYIGSWSGATLPFNGTLTDMRFWMGTALSAAQAIAESNNTTPYSYPSVVPTWQGVIIDALGATKITPYVGSTVFTHGAGAAAPTPTVSDTRLPPTRF